MSANAKHGALFMAMAHADMIVAERLEAKGWTCNVQGADGLGCWDHNHRGHRLIHSLAIEEDGEVWAHVSMSRRDRKLPTWEQLRDLWWLMYPDIVGMQLIVPHTEHVNINEVLHVWGCLTKIVVPDFTHGGDSI